MKSTELVSALRNLKSTFKPMVCIDCAYGNDCIIHGCRLIGLAADRLNEVGIIISIIKGMHAEAKDAEKSLLEIVLSLFDRIMGLLLYLNKIAVLETMRSMRLHIRLEYTIRRNVLTILSGARTLRNWQRRFGA